MLNLESTATNPDEIKLGLALSGGGFRAALFHIGVLAKLAELDLLRQISVISTVSGGSIIGAFYYLKVKQLLEGRRPDALAPSREAYIQLMREIEREFLYAVQRNLRVRAFADRRKNARMFRARYSPTDRLAELFTEYLYGPGFGWGSDWPLKDLPIVPASANVTDTGRIPSLVINATALNTGHLWQFAGPYVGEEVTARFEARYSVMPVFPKLYFSDPTLESGQQARLAALNLGQAVAGSCCVPGLFEPMSIPGLYRNANGEEITVRLVDGGVFDNQGLVSLFTAGCTHIICSDSSDLLKAETEPAVRLVNVAMRANEIMMNRIRGTILDELFSRSPDTYAFFHLGDELGQQVFPEEAKRFASAIARIRTDLDAFSDREAYTLMYYGYRLCERKIPGTVSTPVDWTFGEVENWLSDPLKRESLLLHLDVGSRPLFKVFFLRKSLPYLIVLSALFPPVLILLAVGMYGLYLLPKWASILVAVVLLSLIAYSQNSRINQWLDRLPWYRRTRQRLVVALVPLGIPVLLGILVALVARIQLNVFDRLFLKYGRFRKGHTKRELTSRS
ncbi:MAG: patatin-like phospholipase family protein [Gammaproteobacteria bacterium]|nr:patatin-like phospholipase family protein [Gammaproteobacteria bacterium]MCP5426096.1 patatin-like phospholipase family protein [Gammaproteobacteria bacterium]